MSSQHDPSVPSPLSDRLLAEGVSSIVEAAAAEGVSIGPKQAIRWALGGVRGIRLETVKIGGRRLTSRAAFRRFVAAQQRVAAPTAAALGVAEADKVLAANGLSRGPTR